MATQNEVAAHLFLSTRQVLEHNKRGTWEKGCSVDEAREAYIGFLRANGRGEIDEASDYNKERTLETRARRENLELKNAQLRRELCPVDVIRHVLGKVAAQMHSCLDQICPQLRVKVPKLTATEITIVDREVIKAQNAIAQTPNYLDEWLDDLERATARNS